MASKSFVLNAFSFPGAIEMPVLATVVSFVLEDDSVNLEVFTMAAGARYRGNVRPDPATLIARVRTALKALEDE